MRYAFYITNHGFGHASRNVPVIKNLLQDDSKCKIFVKTDSMRCEFLKRNLSDYSAQIYYYEDCKETGLVLQDGQMIPDIARMEKQIKEDFTHWDEYINREKDFLEKNRVDIVVADIIAWALKAAKKCHIPCVLIGNFTWAQMYKSFYGQDIWEPYSACYQLADKAVWYDIHAEELHQQCSEYECVSLISREVNKKEVETIRNSYSKEIVFVSLGASAEIGESIYVGDKPYEFLTTRGVNLKGENVHALPLDTVNTPDYIAASDYVIAKGGWSTVAEILLQGKKCALVFRGNNLEDNNTKQILERRQHCVSLNGDALADIESVLHRIKKLQPENYDVYQNDIDKVCRIIKNMAK